MLARAAACVLAGALLSLCIPGVAQARTDNRSKPVVYVHGLDAFGTAGADCNMWSNMKSKLASWGWTGAAATIRYYEGDTNCSYAVEHHGSHAQALGRRR